MFQVFSSSGRSSCDQLKSRKRLEEFLEVQLKSYAGFRDESHQVITSLDFYLTVSNFYTFKKNKYCIFVKIYV